MATRTTVETKITAINDRGNNTAVEVRDVLTELLDFSDERSNDLTPYHIFQKDSVKDPRGAALWYSFKGIKNQTVNFTFRVTVLESGISGLSLKIDPKIFEELKLILASFNNSNLSFTVVVVNKTPDGNNPEPRVWSMLLDFDIPKTVINFKFFNTVEKNALKNGDEIFSSIHFHCPEFDFTK
jgi:hypothetical protein